jgi:protein PhnA
MTLDKALLTRSNGHCEICMEQSELQAYAISPFTIQDATDKHVALCNTCYVQCAGSEIIDTHRMRALSGSIWSETSAVKVLSYKILQKLQEHDWAQECLDGAYLTEEEIAWANAEIAAAASVVVHKDAYGAVLHSGDTVLLTENLNVRGTNFIAAKGTKVQKIKLVHDNEEQIEGKIDGSTIVILTKFVRKQG